jgi:NhaP-type Na+/H+ or K+/H+ antiporter
LAELSYGNLHRILEELLLWSFQEIHVNQGLYFLVFGESLFNDGVTVVLYNTMKSLLEIDTVGLTETMLAVLSFFLVAFGGALIGFLIGLFASYVTKYTQQEPLHFLFYF